VAVDRNEACTNFELYCRPGQGLDSPYSAGPTVPQAQTPSSGATDCGPAHPWTDPRFFIRVQGSCKSFSELSSAFPSQSRIWLLNLGGIKLAAGCGTQILSSRTRVPLIASRLSGMGMRYPRLVKDLLEGGTGGVYRLGDTLGKVCSRH